MAKIEKEKNLLKFFDDESNQKIILDINTGEFSSEEGEKIEYIPSFFLKSLRYADLSSSNVLQFLFYQLLPYGFDNPNLTTKDTKKFTAYLKFYDKLDSLNYKCNRKDFDVGAAIEFFSSHFNIFIKCYHEYGTEEINNLYIQYLKNIFFKKYNIIIDKHYFTQQMADIFFTMFSTMYHYNPLNEKYVSITHYYFVKGLWDYEEENWNIFYKLNQYFNFCEFLHLQPEKDVFMRTYSKYKKLYDIYMKEQEENDFIKYQQKYYSVLSFSTDKYIVIVPMSTEEIKKEATAQSNCVEGYIADVANGETNIVFVRNINDQDKSLITCEVSNGDIIQYLLKYNKEVEDKELLQFKELYQKHLKETWKED